MHSPALSTLFFAFKHSLCADIRSQRCLLLGAEAHPELQNFSDLVCEQSFYPIFNALSKLGLNVVKEADGEFEASMVIVRRNVRATLADIARAIKLTKVGGSVIVLGENDLGVKRFQDPLETICGASEVITKNHCRIMTVQRHKILDQSLYQQNLELAEPFKIEGEDLYSSHYGFSANEIDAGSKLLSQNLPVDLAGLGADLGAGSGYLSVCALKASPAISKIYLCEAEWRQLNLAQRTLSGVASEKFQLEWCDISSGLALKDLDFVISNPPFHIGSRTEPKIAQRFIEVAHEILRQQGRFILVANRAFPYEQALKQFSAYQIIEKQRGYAICSAVK